MASVVYNEAKLRWGDASLDWVNDSIKARLCMNTTTCATENTGIAFLSDFTLIDKCDDSGYAALHAGDGDDLMSSLTVVKNDGSAESRLDAADLQWTPLNGDATRDYQGVLIYKFVTNDAASIPICFIDFASDLTALATTVNVTFDAEGVLNLN